MEANQPVSGVKHLGPICVFVRGQFRPIEELSARRNTLRASNLANHEAVVPTLPTSTRAPVCGAPKQWRLECR